MEHLLVICHPKKRSFTQATARSYAAADKSLGHDAGVRGHYRLPFDPVLGEEELPDAFFYPLWWAFMPAMMKGYFDRVFSRGFAYDFQGNDITPLLPDKTALIFTTSGASMADQRRSKQWHAMRVLEEDNILSLCGIKLLEHAHLSSIRPGLTVQTTESHFTAVRRAVEKNWGAQPVPAG